MLPCLMPCDLCSAICLLPQWEDGAWSLHCNTRARCALLGGGAHMTHIPLLSKSSASRFQVRSGQVCLCQQVYVCCLCQSKTQSVAGSSPVRA
eukprot:4115511-Amphidinium_carterae.1